MVKIKEAHIKPIKKSRKMKKMQYFFLVIITLNTLACNSKSKTNNLKSEIKEMTIESNNIVLLLFPSGCEDESCYSYKIEIGESNFKVSGSYYMRYSDDKKSKKLSIQQITELNEMAQNVKNPFFNKESVEDVWGAKMTINGKVLYEVGEFSFESPPDKIKQLINYIIKLSPLKIELYDFS